MDMDFPHKQFQIRVLSCRDALKALKHDVLEGMISAPRSLPPKYFYDETGSRLFDAICKTRHYYLTRTESALLEKHADDIMAAVQPRACVELGAGSSLKTEFLLSRLVAGSQQATYVPIDVCEEVLIESARALVASFIRSCISRLLAGELPDRLTRVTHLEGPVLFVFIGSSIGNFSASEAMELLSRVAGIMAPGDADFTGVDRGKE